ncbi:MAG: NUDIX hydrolase [Candidatus Neomarinimicrobiota bacterium]|jgi:ADP-ribose pyrophosphatase|uniref:Nudix hydrolase domain-containing protein n=1 Tax=marine metagenome TaxID=408172 RepID=A0A381VYU3_9ZZZZ|nr:NUDIX hydrolase [Candidatus Neomarinimicrobiota bacterium]|tara:strand:+ start:1005 stop:1547 length:543 start_codon:yes stop_codon:yes gene_type:complete
MSDLKEFKLSSKIIYRGRFLDVRKDGVRLPNGKITTREWIQHPGAACMVPILPDGQLALIRQYRYPVLQEMIELPAGKLDPGESPEECAKRELEEEIGYKAGKLTYLTHIHPAIGFASEKMWLYLAEELEKTGENTDHDEFVELMPTTVSDAVNMVWDQRVTDVKTIIGILWLDKLRSTD